MPSLMHSAKIKSIFLAIPTTQMVIMVATRVRYVILSDIFTIMFAFFFSLGLIAMFVRY